MEFRNIILDKKEGVATITLNRPKVRNALDTETLLEVGAAVEDIDNDPNVRVVLITGTGKAFCSGADLGGIAALVDKPRDYFLRLWNRVFSAIDNLGKPVIAVINGIALAGGLELVMACDLAIASEDARLSDQHANYGLVPGGGGSQRLPRLIGIRKAKNSATARRYVRLIADSLSPERGHEEMQYTKTGAHASLRVRHLKRTTCAS